MNIPEKAIEAAHRAMYLFQHGDHSDGEHVGWSEDQLIGGLVAAAPFIVARSLRDAAEDVDVEDVDVDYEEITEAAGRRHAADDLRGHADALEAS